MHRNKPAGRLARIALVAVTAICLSGCFDLAQKVSLNRDGSGRYDVAVSSTGIVGDALKNADLLSSARGHVTKRTIVRNGNVTRLASVGFARLSDLGLSDEAISVSITGKTFFGLGPTHAVFRRTFLVQNAKRAGERHARTNDETGNAVIAGLFANHRYTFSVTLPGSIEWIAPLNINGMTIKPRVTGDMFHGHTITWRMPLGLALSKQLLHFAVGFSAYGSFKDEQTIPRGSASL